MDMAKNTITKTTTLLLINKIFILKLISILIVPLFLLVLLHSLVAQPLLQKVEDTYETSSLDPKDVRSLLVLEVPFFIAFSIIWLFQAATTIVAVACLYSDAINSQPLHLKVFELIWNKKRVVARLYASLMMIMIILFLLAAFILTHTIFGSNLILGWIIVVVAGITYPYLASICALGLVISVLEDSCQGPYSLQEASRLVHSRKLQSYVLMLTLTLLSIPIHVIFYVTSMDDDDDRLTLLTGFPFILAATSLFCLANHFTFAVFAFLYLEINHPGSPLHSDRGKLQLGTLDFSSVPCNNT